MAAFRLRLVLFLLAAGMAVVGLAEMVRPRDLPGQSALGSWIFLAGVFLLALVVIGAVMDVVWKTSGGRGEPGETGDAAQWFFGDQPGRGHHAGGQAGGAPASASVAASVALLEDLLAREPLAPERIWQVFREWARHPVAGELEELSASVGHAEGTAWVEFRRTFKGGGAEEDDGVALRLSSARADAPRLPDAGVSCEDRNDLTEFFESVEELPGFTLALAYPHWTLDVERG
jgi:hypothetical protein